MYYQVLLALHIISIISWMAGILYLIRLQINGRDQGYESESVFLLLKGMMTRLYRFITIPAMICSYIFGLGMVFINPTLVSQNWFLVKVFSVIFLTLSTIISGKIIKFYIEKKELPSSKKLRYFNEVPTLLMIIIVFMVILKPNL